MTIFDLRKVRQYFLGSILLFSLFLVSANESIYAQNSSVTTTTVDSTNDDGTDPKWDVSFEVDTAGTNNNANGGWIVQKITMSLKVNPCPGSEGDPIDTTVVYWEVWPIDSGENKPAPEFLNGASDRWAPNPATIGGDTYGTFSVSGEVTFVSNPGGGSPATPGDAGGPDTNRTEDGGSTWGSGDESVPEAGGLTSTYDEPSFWAGLDATKVSSRSWSYSWNNCEDEDEKDPVDIEEGERDGDDEEGRDGGKRSAEVQTHLGGDLMHFYPNPATDQLTIFGADVIETTIYSVSGQVLIQTKDRQVDVQHLDPGSYIIYMSNGVVVQKELLMVR